jgi:Uma2 family endonuclease
VATVQTAKRSGAALSRSLSVRLPVKGVTYTAKAFWNLCSLNPDIPFERNADGSVSVMTPVGGEGSFRSGEIFAQLRNWAKSNGEGLSFDSSGGFTLPNGAVRSPDASWIRLDRWNALSDEEQEVFSPIAPDFVVEVRSKSDKLPTLRKKMHEYIAQGVCLGWLIDPQAKTVEVYRPDHPPARYENPKSLRAGPELPGFALDLKPIWSRKSR